MAITDTVEMANFLNGVFMDEDDDGDGENGPVFFPTVSSPGKTPPPPLHWSPSSKFFDRSPKIFTPKPITTGGKLNSRLEQGSKTARSISCVSTTSSSVAAPATSSSSSRSFTNDELSPLPSPIEHFVVTGIMDPSHSLIGGRYDEVGIKIPEKVMLDEFHSSSRKDNDASVMSFFSEHQSQLVAEEETNEKQHSYKNESKRKMPFLSPIKVSSRNSATKTGLTFDHRSHDLFSSPERKKSGLRCTGLRPTIRQSPINAKTKKSM